MNGTQRAIEIFTSADSLKAHIGEVWEDDAGNRFTLLCVPSDKRVLIRSHQSHTEVLIPWQQWLMANNLPLSMREVVEHRIKESA